MLTFASLLALVSRHPIYDLMRDYLTLSWARFSKDVASHTLQISKILSHPAPRAGDIVRLDASPKEGGDRGDGSLEVVARFPGGLDFGRGLVDINVSDLSSFFMDGRNANSYHSSQCGLCSNASMWTIFCPSARYYTHDWQ